MKKILFSFFATLCIFFGALGSNCYAQKVSPKDKDKVFLEGLALYTLILANWTSNDLYYENEFNTDIVSGYLSYRDKDTLKTIFWREIDTTSVEYKTKTFKKAGDTVAAEQSSKAIELRWVVKTIRYNNMNVSKKNVSIAEEEERIPTPAEKLLMDYRQKAYKEMNKDTAFFKHYAGVKMRAIPIDAGKQVKVYIYSSILQDGVVPIGGDYLLTYDKKLDQLVSKEDLHKECIFISAEYRGKANDASKSTFHKHKTGAAQLITPTDIATLLLYKGQLKWDEHQVISDKYTCIFSIVDRKLDIMLTKDFEEIQKKKSAQDDERKKYDMH